jgi:hypothetical protein
MLRIVFGILNLLVGGSLVLAGRKLFWLLLGAIGFLIGLELATWIAFHSELVLIIATIGLGVVFALMGIFLESVAIGMAGFLGGGLTLMRMASLMGLDSAVARWITFIVGGIIGAVLIVRLFNWALITISSIAGASMIASGLYLHQGIRPLIFLAIAVLGILFQGLLMHFEDQSAKRKQRTAASSHWPQT